MVIYQANLYFFTKSIKCVFFTGAFPDHHSSSQKLNPPIKQSHSLNDFSLPNTHSSLKGSFVSTWRISRKLKGALLDDQGRSDLRNSRLSLIIWFCNSRDSPQWNCCVYSKTILQGVIELNWLIQLLLKSHEKKREHVIFIYILREFLLKPQDNIWNLPWKSILFWNAGSYRNNSKRLVLETPLCVSLILKLRVFI